MSESIWCWNKGNVKIFSSNDEVVKKAQRHGCRIKRKIIKSHIYGS